MFNRFNEIENIDETTNKMNTERALNQSETETFFFSAKKDKKRSQNIYQHIWINKFWRKKKIRFVSKFCIIDLSKCQKTNGICVKPVSHLANRKNLLSKLKRSQSNTAVSMPQTHWVALCCFMCSFELIRFKGNGNAFDALRLAYKIKMNRNIQI